jgi:Tol biopolymer transport system component
MQRAAWLSAFVIAGAGALILTRPRPAPEPVADTARLTYVATAHQLGVVGYRDPVGAISIDGGRLALAEGRRIYETPTGGGVRIEMAAADGQIRHLAPIGSGPEWLFEDTGSPTRWWAVSAGAPRRPLFGSRNEVRSAAGDFVARTNELRQIVASADGQTLFALSTAAQGSVLWRFSIDDQRTQHTPLAHQASSPAVTASGDVACAIRVDGRWRLSIPCGEPPLALTPDVEVIGPLAFSPTTAAVHFASPNERGMVDLWTANLDTRAARQVSRFARDSYAPSVAGDGTVLFKVQSYRTSVAELDLATRRMRQLSTLQAETPSYHPDGQRVGVTYGTWRRVLDDAHYPDIAQEIGVFGAGARAADGAAPIEIIAASDSEDQAMTWSPNGRWIAFHSHREQSDDIWMRPVDRSRPDRRVSFLGRGAEVGWPRWSPDGRWVLYDGASPSSGRSVLFVVGIDQQSGELTQAPREITVTGVEGEITHGEWLSDSATIVAIAKLAPGQHGVLTVPAAGGVARLVHRLATEHDFPGLAVSPDGHHAAFVAPSPDGHFQIFRIPIAGGTPEQLTTDPTHKTQPAWSPDATRIAFTIWSYEVQFWAVGSGLEKRQTQAVWLFPALLQPIWHRFR